MEANRVDQKTLRDYLQVVRRRKWIVLLALVVAPAAAVVLSLRQQPLYQAQAEVLLSRQNLADTLTGAQDPTAYLQAERFAQTQADLAEVPQVAERTLQQLGVTNRSADKLLSSVSVSAKPNADILDVKVKDRSPSLAEKLATEYAHQYTIYRQELDTSAIQRARSEVQKQIDSLGLAGDNGSALYQSLVEKDQQLGTMEALQTSNAFVIRPAQKTVKVQPRPVRRGVMGLVLGLLAGLALAFLWEALDTRIRSTEALSERLGLPLLARIPAPRRKLSRSNKLLMIEEPNDNRAEAFRMLRTNLEFANLERRARTIMITSAVQAEGKSTTISNLAVALARGGLHVVLVDLDLRRPSLHRFFDLSERPGLTQVALGQASLSKALVRIGLFGEPASRSRRKAPGTLEVLGTGPLPPNPGEFVGTEKLRQILAQLKLRAHVVLIDAPSLLSLGDALTLSAQVDALIVVSRLKVAHRPLVDELKRVLELSPAHKLGYIVTGADADKTYDYYYHYELDDADADELDETSAKSAAS